jgi:signal transduction histidine kinase
MIPSPFSNPLKPFGNPMHHTGNNKEKRPFRLVKFFTFSSLIVMFSATIVISALNAHWIRNLIQQKSEEYAHLLIENLNHQVFLQFIVPVVLKYGQIKLSEESQYKRMDRVVKNTLHSFNVENVNVYDLNNIISYSLDKSRIGVKDAGGTGYEKASGGISTSQLVQKGNSLELLLGFPRQTRIVTFAPLKAEQAVSSISGPVLGVVEIVQDISEDFLKIRQVQMLITGSCVVVMAILFIVLRLVVKQGEIIIERRAEERLRLEEKLRQAEHLSSIGEMTAGVSHEIRNPLGIIRSSAELLKKRMAKLDASSTIPDIIVEESVRLDNIIRDFLDYARPRNPDLRPCRPGEVIEKNLAFLEAQIRERNIVVQTRFPDEQPEITADSNMLYQAFLNILLNAFQAMPEGGSVDITLMQDASGVRILFEDSGKGIAEENLKKVWNPFFTTKEMGTGLGLGLVKNIIQAHGGEIELSNREAGGVRVDITLPAKEA